MAKNRTNRTPEPVEDWYAQFLEVLAKTGNVRLSAYRAGVVRSLAYYHYENRPGFAERWDDAIDDSADRLEQEARRRAMQGVPKPVYYQGEQIDVVKEYSDTLLIFLLKGARPEKYRDNYDLAKLANELALARTSNQEPPAPQPKGRRKAGGKGR